MLYIGYFIILHGQNIKKVSFENFRFLGCRGWKTAKAGCAQILKFRGILIFALGVVNQK